jgi:hypothetical protein
MKIYNIKELIEYADEVEKLAKYTPSKEDTRKLVGCYYNHIPELLEYNNDHSLDGLYDDGLIVKTIAHFQMDGRRYWNLSMVYFGIIPIMLVQNAGREGDDHAHRFIFNVEKYKEIMECYGNGHDITVNDDTTIVGDLEQPFRIYTDFYGNDIENSDGYGE